MGRNVTELQDEYEEEFSEFLIQKINQAGGSLQFQHLSGLLQQLRFEIRDAFGVTKCEFMKFLRAHSNTFKVNSKGIVTVVNSSTLDSNDCANEEKNTNTKKTFLPTIKNGKGTILKFFSHYAIIKAESPIKTYVFFTPLEYGAHKDTLFVDLDIKIRDRVCFNAIHGHSDYEIEYRASKVWIKCDSNNENPLPDNLRSNKIAKTEKFDGEGIIKKLFPYVGFISVLSKKFKDVFFYRSDVKDHDVKLGDKVEFVAEKISDEWQATQIIKKKKVNIKESLDNSQTYTKISGKHNISKEKIKNQLGKIYPYSKGAVIKFGKNYSELADGNECNFYLYGIRVANPDIAMEFSEGDDVKFDAIKSKDSPGWKAVVVWVGEKPLCIEIDKKTFKENDRNIVDTNITDSDIASDVSSKSSDLTKRNKRIRSKNNNKIVNEGHKINNKSKSQHCSRNRNLNRFSKNQPKDDSITFKKTSKRLPHKDSKYGQNNNKNKCRNENSNRKYNQNKSFLKPSVFNYAEENHESLPICKETDLDILESSETTSEEDNELQDSPHFTRKFLIENKQCSIDESENNEINSGNDSDKDVSESDETFVKQNSSIKKFEAIDGEITKLYCKFAIIKSAHLENEVDFILNAFYLNGKSVEEQQVVDLKEVIKVEDIIKFNCFEIIDDYGEIHRKVTMAWKGSKPNVYEISPEEFIMEHELHVSISDQQNYVCEPEENFYTTKSTRFKEACELNSEAEYSEKNSLDDTSYRYPVVSESKPEKLPDRILKKLETYGFISSKPEVALNAVQEIIDLVLKNSNIDKSFNFSQIQDNTIKSYSVTVCSSCGNTYRPFVKEALNIIDAEVQTIVTGEIVATNIFTED